jgi:ADP-heptose:LPS heptosyltransferase
MDAMIDQPPAAPLSGKYLVRNRVVNRLLRVTDWLLERCWPPGRAARALPAPRRILLANGAHLGDVVLSLAVLPVFRSAFPRARLGFLIGSWARPVLHDHPLVDWIHLVDHWKLNRAGLPLWQKVRHYQRTRSQALRAIRGKRYDVAIDLYYYFPNSIPLLWQAGIPCRIGYTSGGFGPLLTHGLDWTNQDQHVTAYQADLLRVLPVSDNDLLRQHTPLHAARPLPEGVVEEFRRQGLPPRDFLLFHMGTGAAFKEWPLPCWRHLAERVIGAGHVLAFTGSSGAERRTSDAVMAGLDRCLNLCGRLTWPEFVTTVRAARLLVGVDSVAGHVAALVGTPCVVVSSGITNPGQWGPRGTACKVLSHPVPCAPCYRSRGCDEMECVRGVAVDEVFTAIAQLLGLSHRQSA